MPLGEGSVLGRRYRLLSQIGRGGMGTVWRAHDDLLARDVAVKEVLFPPGLSDDEHKVMYERTLREARSAARLNHPGIVTVHDVVEEDGRPCIVMEFVRSRSLQDIIDQDGRLSPIQVAEIGGKVLAALRTAHDAGITHRDVKPANVLLAGDLEDPITRITRVVITDFGIATMEGDSTLTQTGLIMGSPAYIAPERARGEVTSPASDLWSLGATLYAAVEGSSPHHRPEAMAALTSIISEEAPPPRYAGPLAPVLMGLLAKDPAQRLTAEQAAEGLTRAAHSTRPLPAPATTVGDDQKPAAGQDREEPGPSAAGPRTYEPTAAGSRPPYEPTAAGSRPPYEPSAAELRPPYEASAALAEPGSRAYDPTTRHAAPAGGGYPDPTGRAPAPRGSGGALNVTEVSPDQPWPRADDRPTEGVQGGPKRSNTRAVVLALVTVLVVGGAVVAWMELQDKSAGRTAASGSPNPTPQQSSPSPSTTPSPTIPAGFRLVKAQDGSKLAVPEGWQRDKRSAQSERWIDPKTGDNIQLDTIPWETADPVQHWRVWNGPSVLPGYQSVSTPHSLTARGWKAGDIEYSWLATWKGTRQRTYVLDRGFTVNGRQYALMAAAGDRATAADHFKKAFTWFQPSAN
ncbi:protein kinase domain-containing protein [Actinoallomurus sp. CA-150999]|uniref:serine/threonine-protein kinase n=1 Tax=Actinoallomurus sp. CA-150999 TaxID=3239887 RepID=UPI003D8A8E9F